MRDITPASKTSQTVYKDDVDTGVFRNIRGIIFDFDGTLFDHTKLPFWVILYNPLEILTIWTERMVRKRFAGRDFGNAERYYRAYFECLGNLCGRKAEKVREWYFKRFMPRMVRALKNHYELRPGAKALFDLLKLPKTSPWGPHREIPVAIYSDYPMLRERLEALGLDPGSKIRLYGPESFGAQKPAPRPFRHIAADLGLRPEETLIIGDREDTDGLGALNAGMRFYCLETGRKRHFRLDPGRSPRGREAQVQPILMYLGTWETICRLLHGFIQGSES